jgi:hypothetical protein
MTRNVPPDEPDFIKGMSQDCVGLLSVCINEDRFISEELDRSDTRRPTSDEFSDGLPSDHASSALRER